MLKRKSLSPDTFIGLVHPKRWQAGVEKIDLDAVMTGCRAERMMITIRPGSKAISKAIKLPADWNDLLAQATQYLRGLKRSKHSELHRGIRPSASRCSIVICLLSAARP